MLRLIIIDKDSLIFNQKVRTVVGKLRKIGNSMITLATLYRRINDYHDTRKLPGSGDEGIHRERKPRVAAISQLLTLNNKVLEH